MVSEQRELVKFHSSTAEEHYLTEGYRISDMRVYPWIETKQMGLIVIQQMEDQ